MKIYEVRQLSNEEILKRIDEEQGNILDLRFSHSLKQLVNTAKIRESKRTISQLRTIMNERHLKVSAQEGVQNK